MTPLILFLMAISANAQTMPPPLVKNRMGYFVMSGGTYKGDQVSDATCLVDLNLYDWKNKANAGALTADRVHVWICNASSCTNLKPHSYYTFANGDVPDKGGAVMITDSLGRGPDDLNNWSSSSAHFGVTHFYWTGPRDSVSNSLWDNKPNGGTKHCAGWTVAGGGIQGSTGGSNAANTSRWNDGIPAVCDSYYPIICMVDPQ